MKVKIRNIVDELLRNANFRKFIKFLLVGGTVFIIHTLLLWLFLRVFHLSSFVSATVAYAISTTAHFLMNNFFTFRGSKSQYQRRILGYIAVVVCNYVINTVVVTITLAHVIDNVLVATVASTSITMLFTFIAFNRIVFSNRERK